MSIGGQLLQITRFLLARRIRGANRLTTALAMRWPDLQAYRTRVNGGYLFADLRNASTHALLNGPAPLSEEHLIMQQCILADDVAYDIGANAGVYSVWLSKVVGANGKVFSFEPNPAHQRCLGKTVSLLENTRLLPVGLADREGSFAFFVPEDDTMASLRDWTHGDGGRVSKTSCPVTTIDGLIAAGEISAPDFVKCDIEGGELDCFIGGRNTFDRTDGPIILFEANINSTKGYGNNISSGLDFLASLKEPRYSFFVVQRNALLEPIISIDFQHGNILAVPYSKMDSLEKHSPRREGTTG